MNRNKKGIRLHKPIQTLFTLSLLLMQPMVLAQDAPQAYSETYLGDCNTPITLTFNPRTGTKNSMPGIAPDDCLDITDPAPHIRASYIGKLLNQGPLKSASFSSLGVNPATLVPKGLDLDLFSSAEVSNDMEIKPNLSYGPDRTRTRRGELRYGAPKVWTTSGGELVRLIPKTARAGLPLGEKKTSDDFGDREGVARELQTFFVNGAGEEFSFYPDPDMYEVSANEGWSASTSTYTWYSQSGNYRLTWSGPGNRFELENADGSVYWLERYKEEVDELRGAVSVHYRIGRVYDRYQNQIVYIYPNTRTNLPDELRPFHYNSGTLPQGRHYYGYDSSLGVDRVTSIKVQGSDGVDLIYNIGYPDTNATLAKHAAVADIIPSINSGQLAIAPIHEGLNMTTRFSGQTNYGATVSIAASELPFPLHADLDYYGNDDSEGNVYPSTSYVFEVSHNGSTVYFRVRTGDPKDVDDPRPNPIAYDSATDSYDVRMEQVGGPTIDIPSGTALSGVKIYPLIKNGDRIFDDNGTMVGTVLIDNWYKTSSNDPVTDAAFDPNNVGFISHATPSGALHYVREDQMYRVVEIAMPVASVGGSQKIMRFSYDDKSLNHQEVKTVTTYDAALPQFPNGISETKYTYQRAVSWTVSDDAGDALVDHPGIQPGDWNHCRMLSSHVINGTGSTAINIGISEQVTRQETMLLRQMDEKYVKFDHQWETETTRFGGAYHYALVGQDTYSNGSGEQDHSCDNVQWGLDGRMFKYTWEISPDGTAQVFDLDPSGMGLDSVTEASYRRRQPFKTYQFDDRFASQMASDFPKFYNFVADSITYDANRYLPLYTVGGNSSPTLGDMIANPDMPSSYGNPALADLFGAGFDSKCHMIDVTTFEQIPQYKYSQSTDASNASNYLKRETLKVIHGRYFDTGQIPLDATRTYFQTNGIMQMIEAGISGSDWEDFLIGNRSSTVSSDKYPNTYSETINWTQGGRIDVGNYFQSQSDRQESLVLVPHFNYQLVKYDGFGWDSANNRVNLERNTSFVTGSRYSNGGYLFDTLASGSDNGTSLTVTPPVDLQPGDVFQHGGRIYTINNSLTAGVSNTLSFSPGLDHNFTSEQLIFKRLYNPTWSNGVPTVSNGYLGHDSFGNNQYMERYQEADQMAWQSDDHNYLLPDFVNSNPLDERSNDSGYTSSGSDTNNDISDWSYFGRVGKEYEATNQSYFTYHSGATMRTNRIDLRMYQQKFYNGSFPWLASKEVRYYVPFDSGAEPDVTGSLNTNDEDQITEFSHGTGVGEVGRVLQTLTYKRGDTDDFDVSRFGYKTQGYLNYEMHASFKDGVSPYGEQSIYTVDLFTWNHDIIRVYHATANMVDGLLTFSNHRQQRKTYNEYDNLGRVLTSDRTNPSDMPIDTKTETDYLSLLETETRVLKNDGSALLTTTVTYKDGMMRNLMETIQEGTAPILATGYVYADSGRLERRYENQTLTSRPSWSSAASLNSIFSSAGYIQNVYNSRGLASGEVSVDPTTGWTMKRYTSETQRAATGSVIKVTAVAERGLESGANDVRVTLFQNQMNELNQMWRVTWYEDTPASMPDLGNAAAAENYIDSLRDGQNRLTGLPITADALLDYDRFNNVRKIQNNTTGVNQTRLFYYDQFNRLRQERYPEMERITYNNHDFRGRPTMIGQSLRLQYITYDAYGKKTQVRYTKSGENEFVKEWTYSGATSLFAGLPETVLAYEIDGNEKRGIAYRYTYDREGRILEKAMLQNVDNSLGLAHLASSDLTLVAATNASEWNGGLKLIQAFEDASGLITDMTYPSASGTQPLGGETDLKFHYNTTYGKHITAIEDESLSLFPIQNVTYIRGEKLASYDYGIGTSYETVAFQQAWDVFGRVSQQIFTAGTNVKTRNYAYDDQSRLSEIEVNGSTDFIYFYDSLSQLSKATVTLPGATTRTFEYDYDFYGNLIERKTDGISELLSHDMTNNRISAPGYSYNVWGELTNGLRNGSENVTLSYNPEGRMTRYAVDGSNEVEDYFYDAYGMRVIKKRTAADSSTESRLYFYDTKQMVLGEWLGEDGGAARWDRHYIYLDGKSVLTYEYDADAQSAGNEGAGQ